MYACEPPAPGLLVRADRDKLDQVLINLLSNAIKFTASGGQIRVRCDATPTEVRIHVSDTGCGIPADKLHLIFEPFVQVHASPRSAASEGVGLGLSISRDLMHSMGGDLTVASEPGRGSTFTAILPRAVRSPAPEAAAAEVQVS
jgi:signal transduction histidine kinase